METFYFATLGNRNCKCPTPPPPPPRQHSPERDGLTLLARLQALLLAHLQRVGVFGAEGLLKWQHCLQSDPLEAVCAAKKKNKQTLKNTITWQIGQLQLAKRKVQEKVQRLSNAAPPSLCTAWNSKLTASDSEFHLQ